MTKFLLVDGQGAFLLVDALPNAPTTTTARVAEDLVAVRLADTPVSEFGEPGGDARTHAGDPGIARAMALLHAQEHTAFPRIDPSVIGLVLSADGARLLLVENVRRPGYHTCVAGYVDPGETVEAAWAREVREETGLTLQESVYVGSQPWPQSGALMLAFVSRVDAHVPAGETDGEVRDLAWATRDDITEFTLPQAGTISRTLIERWVVGEFDNLF